MWKWWKRFLTHQTCPVWRFAGHRSFSQGWSHTPAGRYDKTSSDRNGRHGTRPGHRDRGSRMHRKPPHGLLQSGLRPNNQPWKPQQSQFSAWLFWISLNVKLQCHCYLVERRKTQAEVLDGSLNWLISLSLSEAVVLPSSPLTMVKKRL